MRVSPIHAALWLGTYQDTVTNPLFTEGVIHLVESGNFTSLEIFDPMEGPGTPSPLARSMIVWSFQDILALPTQQPLESPWRGASNNSLPPTQVFNPAT